MTISSFPEEKSLRNSRRLEKRNRCSEVQICRHKTYSQRNQRSSMMLKCPLKVMIQNKQWRREKQMTRVAEQRPQWLYHRIWIRPPKQLTVSTKCNKALSFPLKTTKCGPLEPELLARSETSASRRGTEIPREQWAQTAASLLQRVTPKPHPRRTPTTSLGLKETNFPLKTARRCHRQSTPHRAMRAPCLGKPRSHRSPTQQHPRTLAFCLRTGITASWRAWLYLLRAPCMGLCLGCCCRCFWGCGALRLSVE
ncbi:hypothetical protein Tc00.1047053433061.10 [Trypanosoma cruzi]|uniref:Uncharacterized protein n=1 Tax=Trypanosoma cruzi (strain CL Brener) TaxID=353153 RepID=Q4CKL3_TRYCC|nr:hypothetical protein Tc00.1047053433061.10 [Trypanosoma cruzi]EAN80815.1 hypothetical protein Tc00.1047053433061.10 [Trypanosoma cruzi]|eukprot:XP_802261.1 hypothetical protein [Trypanosoma cruzi strain CL Brener]